MAPTLLIKCVPRLIICKTGIVEFQECSTLNRQYAIVMSVHRYCYIERLTSCAYAFEHKHGNRVYISVP